MKLAIPHHDGEVTPCFEYTAGITIYSIRKNRVIAHTDFKLHSKEELDRVRLLRDQGVTVLICSGIQTVHERLLLASGIQVISWISGKVSDVLRLYLQNKLVPDRPGEQESGSDTAREEGSTIP
jgi:predicted Fe-Mo cluster-binding NifX family protein